MRLTKSDLADLLELSRSRISQLLQEGLPEEPDGTIEATKAVAWIFANLTGPNARATRDAARRLAITGAMVDGIEAVMSELPVSVTLAASELGLPRETAERLANFSLLFAGTDIGEQLATAGVPQPKLPHPNAWPARVNWGTLFPAAKERRRR